MTSIKDFISSLNQSIDYKNFSEEVQIIKENRSGDNYSLYTVKNKNNVIFQKVPGAAGIKDSGFMGFINGDRGRPALIGAGTKVDNTKSIVNPPWIEMASITPPWMEFISLTEYVNIFMDLITRTLFGGGLSQPNQFETTVDYVSINSLMNALDFADLSLGRGVRYPGACSNNTRAVFGGGDREFDGSPATTIQYFTIASLSNGINYGNLSSKRRGLASASDNNRAIFAGGHSGSASVNIIDYMNISSGGTALDFGDLTVTRTSISGSSDSTRAVFGGGVSGSTRYDTIDYITIQSLSNAQDFGDLLETKDRTACASNLTRALFFGGSNAVNTLLNVIEYITIQSIGNSQDFGDLTVARTLPTASGNTSRLLAAGGLSAVYHNEIDYVNPNSLGNALDFGDLTVARYGLASASGY